MDISISNPNMRRLDSGNDKTALLFCTNDADLAALIDGIRHGFKAQGIEPRSQTTRMTFH
jgi:hypothetical protein